MAHEKDNGANAHLAPPLLVRESRMMRSRQVKSLVVFLLTAVLVVVHWDFVKSLLPRCQMHDTIQSPIRESKDGQGKIVQLEAHIMSKCPDARDCLNDLIIPAMSRVDPSKVNFTLSFIGTPTDPDDGVICKHGAEECLGNIIELCAANLYPSPKTYLGFTMCLSNNYQAIPERELVQNCALEHGLSFDKINECASRDDGFGIGLLRDSVRRSMEKNVSISCTLRLNEEVRCVRVGGEWKDCKDGHSVKSLIRDIERAYKGGDS